MNLIENAGQWHKLWSIRFALLSAMLAAAEAALPLWSGLVPPHVFATLSTLCGIASAVSRVVQQPALRAGVDGTDPQ
ncbi:hypothetical protein F1_00011 [Ralstonia phage Heva]|uniref:Holin n=2 Tax=Cimandefvirus TaxID=2843366 RepID=A0A7G5BAQ2_9CAUD|nr:holin [Ralstonia phage Cimandef]YP_010078482.1 holin [Ralstonia phage Heva]QMV32640.1 hypothetical protein B2_00005 [Ralstonia phage Cimandef]QMV32880.1 hypothetical protein D1_00054 [Ralstonia phage Dimitile]QMV33375.1 hypothetical protein F1_00011 [Ralstonia phage Heva]